MAMTHKASKMAVGDIKFKLEDNVRLTRDFEVAGQKVDTYDLPTMIGSIIAKRGIVTPLVLNALLFVLQGFRRLLAARTILADVERYLPDLTIRAEVLENLKKVPVLIYGNLTPQEERDLVNDHGDRKDIGRTELIRTVWKLKAAGHTETEISNQLTYALAKYTGNERKLNTLPPYGSPERIKRVAKWFHGTVQNKMLGAFYMGQRVQTAYLLSEMANDGLLPKDEDGNLTVKPEFKVKGDRIGQLSKCVTQDKEKGQWDENKLTGPAFEAKIAEFIVEDETGKSTPSDTRMSATEMKQHGFTSEAFRTAFRRASGEVVMEAHDLDVQTTRNECMMKLIHDNVENVANPQVKDVLARVLSADPTDFQAYLLAESEVVQENASNGVAVS